MNIEQLANRVDELLALGDEALKTEYSRGSGFNQKNFLDLEAFYAFRASSMSFILNIFGENHPYFTDFTSRAESAQPTSAKRGKGILIAIKNEIENGWLNTTKGLISADIFGDFLEMAEHLLNEGYKDAAAVIIGSTLEQHLRTLAETNEVPVTIEKGGKVTPIKADTLNADLTKAGVYTKLDQKNITYWLGVRNDAAHGKYDSYNNEQIQLLINSVSEFMGRQ